MNNKSTLTLPLVALLLAQGITPGWAGVWLNPTICDGGFNTRGGTDVLKYNVDNTQSLPQTGVHNTGFGMNALYYNNIGNYNTATGSHALYSNTTGYENTANGNSALSGNTTGSFNTASGSKALISNTTGENNTASGVDALHLNTTGSFNTANGSRALFGNNGSYNTASGFKALVGNKIGSYNTAIGLSAIGNNDTGNGNTASGVSALYQNTTGNYNTANGINALYQNTTGNGNAAVGTQALYNNITGGNNLALGINAGINLTDGSNNIYLRNPGAVIESDTIRIGNANHSRAFLAGVHGKATSLANAVTVFIDSKGQLGTLNSSERYKKDIRNMDNASRRLLELRPVTYRYKQASEDGSNPLEYGLIAEEVAKVYPDLVVYGADGKVETVQYHKLTPMLVNEVQRLAEKNQFLDKELKAEQLKNQQQAQEILSLKQQMAIIQTQAQRIEALTGRLSRIEAKEALGMAGKDIVKTERKPG